MNKEPFEWEDWRKGGSNTAAFLFYCIGCPLAVIMIAFMLLSDKL